MPSSLMASSSSKALSLASLPGPPPTPTSLLDLPQPWLLQLVICKGLDRQRASLLAFFRTCTFLRDAVARHRTAAIAFNVPIDAEDFPAEVEWLCTVARRSTRVRLVFEGQQDEDDEGPGHAWTETEPHITHLLVCAMAQLEGEQPLACVKEIDLLVRVQRAARSAASAPPATSRASSHVAWLCSRAGLGADVPGAGVGQGAMPQRHQAGPGLGHPRASPAAPAQAAPAPAGVAVGQEVGRWRGPAPGGARA